MRDTKKFRKWVAFAAITVGLSGIGVSFPAWAGTSSVIKAEDLKIYLDSENTIEQLEATIVNKENILIISGMESFEMSKLISGDTSICIDYTLENVGLNKEVQQISLGEYDLGIIPFHLSVEEPYPFWKIINKNGSWGIGVPDIGVPCAIYGLLPVTIGEVHGYNNINAYKNGVVKGTITLKHLMPNTYMVPEIKLSELALSPEINQKIIANKLNSSRVEIMANYKFDIPFIQTNCLQVYGNVTLRMYANVIHDVN